MEVLIIDPGKKPEVANIEDTLESLRSIVGGPIEAIYPFDDPIALICNEEGKLIGLQLNRSIEDYDIIAGTFMVTGLTEDNFGSLSPELLEKYEKHFHNPEAFMRVGNEILRFPMKFKEDLPEKPLKKSSMVQER